MRNVVYVTPFSLGKCQYILVFMEQGGHWSGLLCDSRCCYGATEIMILCPLGEPDIRPLLVCIANISCFPDRCAG
jgi:hypothetical protein